MDAWGRLVFTTQDGVRTEAPWFDSGSFESESPCVIENRYSVRLKPDEVYQVSLQPHIHPTCTFIGWGPHLATGLKEAPSTSSQQSHLGPPAGPALHPK